MVESAFIPEVFLAVEGDNGVEVRVSILMGFFADGVFLDVVAEGILEEGEELFLGESAPGIGEEDVLGLESKIRHFYTGANRQY